MEIISGVQAGSLLLSSLGFKWNKTKNEWEKVKSIKT